MDVLSTMDITVDLQVIAKKKHVTMATIFKLKLIFSDLNNQEYFNMHINILVYLILSGIKFQITCKISNLACIKDKTQSKFYLMECFLYIFLVF